MKSSKPPLPAEFKSYRELAVSVEDFVPLPSSAPVIDRHEWNDQLEQRRRADRERAERPCPFSEDSEEPRRNRRLLGMSIGER